MSRPTRSCATFARQLGVGLPELLAVLAVAGALFLIAAPGLREGHERQKAHAFGTETVKAIRYARMSALKEKVPHRVLFRDAGDATANTIEVQREQAGGFVTIPGQVHSAPTGVSILNEGFRNSVDSIVVGSRGECQAGTVYIQGHQILEVVTIQSTCQTQKVTDVP